MVLDAYLALLAEGWAPAFAQRRTLKRAIEQAAVRPFVNGPQTITAAICTLGRGHLDWGAHYKVFSRSRWEAQRLFSPVEREYLARYPHGPVVVALDDTRLSKRGKKIPTAFWQRDPMSPPFRHNLTWGLRFVQLSLLFPHYEETELPARAYPVLFQDAPAPAKPRKNTAAEVWREYRRQQKQHNLSRQALADVRHWRQRLDQAGAQDRPSWLVVDGSFCNRTFFRSPVPGIQLIARCRKDARLCFPAPPGSRRKYAPEIFTPEQVRIDDHHPWREARIFFGGQWRQLRYKQVSGVLWKRGGGRRLLRLLVLAATPYRRSRNARLDYRDPGYLLVTELEAEPEPVVQAYCDRWQIEINHRDEKSLFGVGDAQLWSPVSVPRHPAFAAAAYSLLLLAALRTLGPHRSAAYLPLPKWRKPSPRPSLQDILNLVRRDVNETPVSQFLDRVLSAKLRR